MLAAGAHPPPARRPPEEKQAAFFNYLGPEARAILNDLLEKYATDGELQFTLPDVQCGAPVLAHGHHRVQAPPAGPSWRMIQDLCAIALGPVSIRCLLQRSSLLGGNPDCLAMAPHGKGSVTATMVLDHFGDCLGQSLHRLLRE
jgi:hypothetical protein